ncbi:hypothetical protein FRACYDRAFT_261933 [Fragilariopsis cylindrus CCMP1102]|uniref:Uncharacterized protein n=1 Tax=Fragilariopsis cylindrus CCMP1102 TaxID=635003 RepID=A0A1E7F7Y2_9STRA|nr:hypothetical protein FRACYDRAFT_261933 [Fragilariopsis cylindrus CCMP1102]|eukprot:OEU14298.1 hypothetical protein FRACYDRAFT_261933 [Fragilariopsis cylindrus CCMP1102]
MTSTSNTTLAPVLFQYKFYEVVSVRRLHWLTRWRPIIDHNKKRVKELAKENSKPIWKYCMPISKKIHSVIRLPYHSVANAAMLHRTNKIDSNNNENTTAVLFLLLKIFNNHLMVKEDETQNCFLMELAVGDYFKSMSSGEFQINFQVTDYGL